MTANDDGNNVLNQKISGRLSNEINEIAVSVKEHIYNLNHTDASLHEDSKVGKMLFEQTTVSLLRSVLEKLKLLFNDACDHIYIPSGRSVISTYYDFIEVIFKELLSKDILTHEFMVEVFNFKKRFKNVNGLLQSKALMDEDEAPVMYKQYALKISERILKGSYDSDGEQERLMINGSSKFVNINHASSGQQETVWIINLLLYYIVYNKPYHVFIEEPEAHLYPTVQQDIVRFIVNFFNANVNNRVFIPTHSPYVLSEINNLVYAERLQSSYPVTIEAVNELVDETTLLPYGQLGVYSILDAKAEFIFDEETKLIDFTKLDSPAAQPINELFDKLYDLEDEYGGD
jgi:predicted ATP-dependent endonuclease of OLD family